MFVFKETRDTSLHNRLISLETTAKSENSRETEQNWIVNILVIVVRPYPMYLPIALSATRLMRKIQIPSRVFVTARYFIT